MSDNYTKVGVACLVFKDGKVLLGKRVSKSHGDGEYTCGGGHAEFMESLAESARREIVEEWGIKISALKIYQRAGSLFLDTSG